MPDRVPLMLLPTASPRKVPLETSSSLQFTTIRKKIPSLRTGIVTFTSRSILSLDEMGTWITVAASALSEEK